MTQRLYLETAILSYLAARPSRDLIQAAHQRMTLEWWGRLHARRIDGRIVMQDDPIAEEVRKVKEEHAARYDYDIRAMARALQEEQKQGGRRIVSLPPQAHRSVK